MGYVAAKGGLQAILAAEELVRRKRDGGPSSPGSKLIRSPTACVSPSTA